MTEEELKPYLNPHSFLTDPIDIFDVVAVPLPPGTKAPPRPPGKERTTSELPVTEPFEIFTEQAVPLPPGTKPPPRPPGKERDTIPASPDAEQVTILLSRIETALQAIHAAIAEIKQLQGIQIQSKAG